MSDGNISLTFLECSSGPHDLDNQVSRLQHYALLGSNSFAFDVEQLLQILEQCLSMCTTELLDKQIFSKILPKAHRFLSEIFKDIDNTVTDSRNIDDVDAVKRKLSISNGLLALWKTCLERISALEKIQACCVISLCDILPETIKIVFEHCKASSKYGALLNGAIQELKNLFAKASSIFKLFFIILDNVIIFDIDVPLETELLIKVIDTYGNVASITNGMDTKTFVELTEAFAKLVIVHQNSVKSCSITMHIGQMAKDTSYLLSNQESNNMDRIMMALTRLLKILEKLTMIYVTSLTYETMSDLVELLLQMHGYLYLSRDCEKTLPISVTSFLDIIFNHNDFKQVYFEYGKQIASLNGGYKDRLSYQLLTIAIMKKLNHMPFECHQKWSLGLDSILDVAFTYIKYFEKEICAEKLRLPGAYEIGERPRLVNIYEVTLVSICNLVTQIAPKDFYMVELLLLKYLLSGYLWSSLLSSDVWYYIARLSTSQLCVNHIKYLIKVSAVLRDRSESIESIMVDNTIIRLYELLTADAKSNLLEDLDLDILNHSVYVVCFLTTRTKILHSKLFRDNNLKDLSKIFWNLQEHPSAYNWRHFIQLLSLIMAVNYSDNEDIIDILPKIWSFVKDAITGCESKQLDILSNLILILLNITQLKSFQDDAFHLILTSIEISCVCLLSRGKIEVCQFLQKCVEDFNRCTVQKTALNLAGLFSQLLQTESPWVRQETLETFEHVGHTCSEQLVAEIAQILAKISDISDIMQAYLSSKPCYTLKGFANIQNYFKHLAKALQDCRKEHTCYEYDELEREKIPRLEKMENFQTIVPVSIQLDERAEKLYLELTKVLEGHAVISNTICTKLIIILKKILEDVSENKVS